MDGADFVGGQFAVEEKNDSDLAVEREIVQRTVADNERITYIRDRVSAGGEGLADCLVDTVDVNQWVIVSGNTSCVVVNNGDGCP